MNVSTHTRLPDDRLVVRTRVEEARPGRGEDRISVGTYVGGRAIIVADGAGGVSGGAKAADLLCGSFCALLIGSYVPNDWSQWLRGCDHAMVTDVACGLAATVVLSVADDGSLRGASVGDCEAWIFEAGKAIDLTGSQRRKPMLGSGNSEPVAFYGQLDSGTLVMGTDGLWKYTRTLSSIGHAVDQSLDDALASMLDGVRLRSGTLQDDVGLAVCRRCG
jgi:PPM family protein phosphatase